MKRAWPIIAVKNVRASSDWYRRVLGCTNNHPNDEVFDQILDRDGTVLLCLHRWGEHDHPSLSSLENGSPGNGLLLFFCVDDFDAALHRVNELGLTLEQKPHTNPNTRALEFSLRDPDNYFVTVSAFDVTLLHS